MMQFRRDSIDKPCHLLCGTIRLADVHKVNAALRQEPDYLSCFVLEEKWLRYDNDLEHSTYLKLLEQIKRSIPILPDRFATKFLQATVYLLCRAVVANGKLFESLRIGVVATRVDL